MHPTDPNYSSEMETLDQLLGGDQKLSVIRTVFQNDQRFLRGLAALLREGDVTLLVDGMAVPEWKTRELLRDGGVLDRLGDYTLHLTDKGAGKLA